MNREQAHAIAIRADESAKAAHQRLDRMNGSIDRLAGQVLRVNEKADQILVQLAKDAGLDEGVRKAHRSVLDSSKWVVGLAVTFFGGGIGTVIVTYFVRR